ncbi:MAG: bifunctional riboflavin kinase/FAD synthetase [Aquisalinus sp.]|nr:bifunctional riboflavin kinase/FAD synthetase [Aquisalinus sp.]
MPIVLHTPLDCALSDTHRGHVAVMGNMDGVHKGHQVLIAEAISLAREIGKPLGAIIFDPHPRQVFDPGGDPFLLTSREQKIALLAEQGIETVFVLPFNRQLSMLTPEEFVHDILGNVLGLAGVVVGEGFRFGQKRAGTTQMLETLGAEADINVRIVTPATMTGASEKYSSSQARAALRDGDPRLAAQIMGRSFTVEGVVQKGQQLGRTLNFPTANISMEDYLHPAKGVYAVTVQVGNEHVKGVANFGNRPTVDGTGVLLEVFLFDFAKDIYGETIAVAFHHFIRPEQKFDGLDALKDQVTKDCDQAIALLA